MKTRLAGAISALVLVFGAVLAADARADGLPVEGVDASLSGVSGTDPGEPRYVTLPAEKGTVVAAVEAVGGRVLRSRFLPGRFTVPVVAYDGSASGLSADGRTLVLIRPRIAFPRRTTTFAVLGAQSLRPREIFTLEDDYSFDALSPDGRWLYLVEYLSRRDPTHYLVRLYDLERSHLLPEPIIDPREVGDVMRGMPVTRASSPDGRFAYTLYDGAGRHPFVHALDTVGRTARCIDLHGLTGYEFLSELQLDVSPDGGTLSVMPPRGTSALFLIDTRTDEATEPAAPDTSAGPQEPDGAAAAPSDEPSGVLWPLTAGAGVVLLLLLIGGQRLLRRRSRRPSSEPLDLTVVAEEEIEVELGDPLLDEAPESERPPVLVP